VNILIDPGRGSLVKCASSRPRLDPSKLDAIIRTHRHLDHAGDINVMVEAMTEGGFKKKGLVFCPQDALGDDSVILKHALSFPERIEILKPETKYKVADFEFSTSMRHIHPVETYGLKFKINKTSVSLLTDTKYFPELKSFYDTQMLIIHVVFDEPRPGIDHLSLPDIEALLKEIRPEKAILTHFGMTMIKAKPHIVAERLSRSLSIDVISAYDGLALKF